MVITIVYFTASNVSNGILGIPFLKLVLIFCEIDIFIKFKFIFIKCKYYLNKANDTNTCSSSLDIDSSEFHGSDETTNAFGDVTNRYSYTWSCN